MTLNLMISQLHMNWEMGCLILYKILEKVSSTQPLRSAAGAQSQDLQNYLQTCNTNPHFVSCLVTGDLSWLF
jgi:hypothetical protein